MTDKVKRPVGRPSELAETLVKAKEYLFGGYELVGEVIPSVAGLSCYTGKPRHRLREYGTLDEEFRATLDAISSLQESRALNKGLTGEFNATITKLILANHGYSDKVETDLKSTDGSMSPKESVDAKLVTALIDKLVD
jgi:hypothetical protein